MEPVEKGWRNDPHNAYTFSGKEFDEESGLQYFGARSYDPWSGTWITQDVYRGEITDPASLHRYGFVENNPINFIDPNGLKRQGIGGLLFNTMITQGGGKIEPEDAQVELFNINNAISTQQTVVGTVSQQWSGNLTLDFSKSKTTLTGDFDITQKYVPTSGETTVQFGKGEGGAEIFGPAIGGQITGATVQGNQVTQLLNKRYTGGGGQKFLTPSAKFALDEQKALAEAKRREQTIERLVREKQLAELERQKLEEGISPHISATLKGIGKEAKGDLEIFTQPKQTLTGLASLLAFLVQANVNAELATDYQIGFFDHDPKAEEYINEQFEEQNARADAIAEAFKEEHRSCSPSGDIFAHEECAGRIGYNFIPVGVFLKILKIPGKIPPGLNKLDEVMTGARKFEKAALAAKNAAGLTIEQARRLENRLINIKVGNKNVVQSVKVFGSRTKATFKPTSDLDVLVVIPDNAFRSERLLKIVQEIENDFTKELGFKVNIAVHESTNIGRGTLFQPTDLLPLQ